MANEFRVKNGIISPSLILQGTTSGTVTITAGENASGTFAFPEATGTIAIIDAEQTVSNKSFQDDNNYFVDVTDPTKRFKFELSGVTTNSTRTLGVPDADSTLVGTSATQTITNKTINLSTANSLVFGDRTFVAKGTQAGIETTVTFADPTQDRAVTFQDLGGSVALSSNKLDFFASTTSAELASKISDETGTGSLVFAQNPTFSLSLDATVNFDAFASVTDLDLGYNGVNTSTTNLVPGISGNGVVKTINIGAGGSSTSVTNINFGSNTTGALGTATFHNNVVVSGDLTVNGLTTTVNSNTITVDDKNIELGSVVAKTGVTGTITSSNVSTTITDIPTTKGLIPGQTLTRTSGIGAFGGTTTIQSIDSLTSISILSASTNTPGSVTFNVDGATDTTAIGGGITLKGATDKVISWQSASAGWTSNQNFNLSSGNVYKINGNEVLSATKVLGVELTGTGNVVTSGSFWVRTFAFMGT